MAETNNNTIANNDVTTKTVKIVPNEELWIYINRKCIYKLLKYEEQQYIWNISKLLLRRGGSWWYATGADVFASDSTYGKADYVNGGGFLPVLVVD